MTVAPQQTNGHAGPARAAPSKEVPWTLPDALAQIAVGGAELLAEDTGEPVWVVKRLIETTDVVMLTGREKDALKTWAGLDLAVARIVGGEWLGWSVAPCDERSKVLFVSCETSPRNIAVRLRALCAGRGVAVERVAEQLLVVFEPISLVPREQRDRAFDAAHLRAQVSASKMVDAQNRKTLWNGAKAIAEGERRNMGRNLKVLAAIEDAPEGTWGLIVADTLRQCLEGDENSSQDASRFTQACRELARAAGCPVVVTHHSNKSGDGSDARSARGSVELTAGPDVLLSVDASGEYPTMHAKLRNHEAPLPVGYALVEVGPLDGGGLRLEVREAAGPKGAVAEEDVLHVFESRPNDKLTVSSVRGYVAEERGGSKGAKANAKSVVGHLEALLARGVVEKVQIDRRGGEPLGGWRLTPGRSGEFKFPTTKGTRR